MVDVVVFVSVVTIADAIREEIAVAIVIVEISKAMTTVLFAISVVFVTNAVVSKTKMTEVILSSMDIDETVTVTMIVWDAMIIMFGGAGSGSGSKERCESKLHLEFKFVFLFGLMRHNFRLLLNGWVFVNRLGQIWLSEKFKAAKQRIC